MKRRLLSLLMLGFVGSAFGQYASEYDSGMVVKLNESGSKNIRFILWGQTWFQDYEGHNANDGFSIKRARVLAYSQINDRFMILTHFGVNGITDNNLTPTGKSNDVSMFLHEMFLQYNLSKNHSIGAGLHNYGGISRLNGQGTINMLTLDNNRSSWSTLGLSDQFSNHLGIFAKGRVDKFNYRFALGDALTNTTDGNASTMLENNQVKYLGKALLDKGKYVVSGYVDYQFLDQESNFLPYRVGTYLGAKKVFNIGAGFFHHKDGLAKMTNDVLTSESVTHLAVDAFYDTPIGQNNSAITAYASFQNSQMGDQYLSGNIVGDGNQFYGHVGYLIPKKIEEGQSPYRNRIQPYVGYSHRDFKALSEPAKELRIGGNWYIDGHNARISIEYQKAFDQPENRDDMVTVQAMILL